MDIEKLIRRLRNDADAYRNGKTLGRAFVDQEDVLDNAAAALSMLQTENEKLLDKIEDARLKGYAKGLGEMSEENEKLRAKLKQVKAERDAAISDLETIMAYGGGNLDTCQYCKNGQCYARGGTKLCLPQWRGQKED